MRTNLHQTKLRAVAQFAQFCVRNPDLLTDKLIPQTLGVAVRKLHDFGECSLGSGKYLGHPCWSRAARNLLIENGGKLKGIQKSLAHEHVVPVQLIVQELLTLPKQAKIEQYEEVIRNLSLVAIITRDEESKHLRPIKLADAPNERWFEKDPWWRYRQAGMLKDMLNEAGKRIQIKA